MTKPQTKELIAELINERDVIDDLINSFAHEISRLTGRSQELDRVISRLAETL